MGMTDELNVGHYVKRLTAIDTSFGDADLHLDRFCEGAVAQTGVALRQPAKKWKQLV
jgi:hypothetical protein